MAGTLSDGERQKMMTAKALAQQTSVVFLDEPTAFLDYGSKVETLQMLRSLCHDNGKTILLSTHDLELALQIADDLWVMTHERLIRTYRRPRRRRHPVAVYRQARHPLRSHHDDDTCGGGIAYPFFICFTETESLTVANGQAKDPLTVID